ncbi:hypothetical protein V493_00125 [Pseudogymnoascus sp. VKM F-4281 (FW-2241)]|nr:hypothetical protein V493_00125 [Pseudogymnoascus sp. VKM F-4281 (FW-2241)]
MLAVILLLQAAMATSAMVWFILYERCSINYWLFVTIVLFTLSTLAFVLRHLSDINTYGVPTTFVFLILAPILGDCSPFQGRDIVAAIPLFVCTVLFCIVEVGKAAKATLDRLADRRAQEYIPTGDAEMSDSTAYQYNNVMTDAESLPEELPGMPKPDPEWIDFDTRHAGQEDPFRYKQSVGSSDSLQLSTSSRSARTSIIECCHIDVNLTEGITNYTPPRNRGPFNGHCVGNYTFQIDADGHRKRPGNRQSVVF